MEAGPRDSEESRVDRVPESRRSGPTDLSGGDGVTSPGSGTSKEASDVSDGARNDEPGAEPPVEEPQELRPQRRMRLWQLAPIVVLGALGSLMFAFPLAFEPGGSSGAVVAMLGLLIFCCAAGWGVMAARRVGHIWPGLPEPGSGQRADWRVALLYALVVGTVSALAVWRVARLN